eukprot:469239-Pleurochrysis_carterae.AAC.1
MEESTFLHRHGEALCRESYQLVSISSYVAYLTASGVRICSLATSVGYLARAISTFFCARRQK